jgi:cold-inducible RNA-binding protein
VKTFFAEVGTCESAAVITDRESGRSRGFGFVEMASNDEVQKGIAALNGRDVQGRQLNVSEAKERADRGGGRSFSGPPQLLTPAGACASTRSRQHSAACGPS